MALPLSLALFHWLLGVLLQTENFLIYQTPGGKRSAALPRWCLLVPRLQSEYLLVAGLIGGLALFALPSLLGRWLFFAVYTALTCHLVLGQLYYKRFFDHFRPSFFATMGTVRLRSLMQSARFELDKVFCLNVVVAAGFLAWFACCLAKHPEVSEPWFGQRMLLRAGVFLALLGLSVVSSVKLFSLERHPLVILLDDVTRKRFAPINVARDTVLPEPEGRPSLEADMAAATEALRRRFPKPNVILVVLESVGALQLFDQAGKPSEEITPHLAELVRHGLLFDSVYSVYPATLRNHIALETGGAYPTSEPQWIDAASRYGGATLPRHFGMHGYRTGFFTTCSLDGDSMHGVALGMGYETIYHFNREIENADPLKIHGWGSLETCTLDRIEHWIDDSLLEPTPFFLTYWTNATHHPYGAPPDYAAPFAGDDLETRYRNSLHYTDAMLHRLVEYLRRHDLWDNTIIALTGDHGEAFGTIHPNNCMHGAHLYEENVRSFLLFLNSGRTSGPIVSSRPGSSGDILPTLADVAGLALPEVPGKSLCSGEMAPRFIFFFTFANSERRGLRDGKWKFVLSIRDGRTELYDLSADPTEQTNVAGQHPARIRGYTLRCQLWFQSANEQFCRIATGDRRAA